MENIENEITVDYVKSNTPEQFWSKIKFGELNECWEWQRSLQNKGYGNIRYSENGKRTTLLSHRFMARFIFKKFDSKLDVLHTCDNPKCVNPNHLWQGTHTDNMRDMFRKGRRKKITGCKGSKNAAAKLTEDHVMLIKMRLNIGERGAALARIFNISKTQISRIKRGTIWKNVQLD